MDCCVMLLRLCVGLAAWTVCALGSSEVDGDGNAFPALWGTYRPHALMSVRARVPHSPHFGIAYHSANSDDVRYLASDHESSLRSYGFSRHDGNTFAEHVVEDIELNLALTYSFVRQMKSDDLWSLRVSGAPLDESTDVDPVSVVLYAAAGPDELEEKDGASGKRVSTGPWGTIRLDQETVVEDSGVRGDCIVTGDAASIGGKYKLVAREPRFGSVSSAERLSGGEGSIGGSSASRSRRISRFAVSSVGPDLSRFQISIPPTLPEKAFLVDEVLKRLLQESKERSFAEESTALGGDLAFDEDDVASQAQRPKSKGRNGMITLRNNVESGRSLVFVQRILQVPFEVDFAFAGPDALGNNLGPADADDGVALDLTLRDRRRAVDDRFESVFPLKETAFGEAERDFARKSVANMLGGIGYFYGRTLVETEKNHKVYRAPAGLLTATPSRALFPRGFLWDEGFHQLIVQRWDPTLSRACLTSWLAQMDGSGWIPREQAVGLEARHRFPDHVKHLMIQRPNVANPPTILMPLRVFAFLRTGNGSREETACSEGAVTSTGGKCAVSSGSSAPALEMSSTDAEAVFIESAIDKAILSFEWLVRSQSGELDGTFRWRGRSRSLASPDGYPLTLASGLDDYPRGYSTSDSERHLDLHCWVAWAAGALSKLLEAAGRDSQRLDTMRRNLLTTLESAHAIASSRTQDGSDGLLLCDFDGEEHVCEIGYVTILPLVLGLLDVSSPRVGAILRLLKSKDILRSPAGVRSLSKQSRHYRKGNDYWTGPVWMPFNYLVLASLRTKYGREEGPYRLQAEELYSELKRDILANAQREFESSGYLWENYSPSDGRGKGGRQFTGWSALVVLIAADIYDGVL